jgi:peptide deformylase
MILTSVKQDDPILRQKIEPFNFKETSIDPIQLAVDLYETLMSSSYIGLSAPQVGLPYRAFALRTQPGIVCFNPKVVDTSTEEIVLDEVDFTFPHLSFPVKRPKKIKVRYAEPNSIVKTVVFEGMTARYFLQQLDHLDGILYTQKANKIHLDRALRKKKQLERQAKVKG